MPDPETLPLFPLPTVLVPGATLGLRVFEPRYLDLVRECGRSGRGFGICLQDGEDGAPAATHGAEALIEDFDTGDDGLLTIKVRGARRFRITCTRVRDNGLVVAEVVWRADSVENPALRPEHALLGTLLERVIEQVGNPGGDTPRFGDAAWVGWRLAEMLPIDEVRRHALLEIDDPHARLSRLLSLID
jgi:Lon protease-like protein